MITATFLHKLFKYDPASGKLTRRIRRCSRALVGAVVGSKTSEGYLAVEINEREYKVHRVIWCMVTGAWPEMEIDHINRVRDDNRLENLRAASSEQNRFNRSVPRNNTSGTVGARLHKPSGKWQASISIRGTTLSIGYFATHEEAAAARDDACRAYHGQFFADHTAP